MPHFPARASLAFAVEVKFCHRIREHASPVWIAIFPKVTEEVQHDHRLKEFRGAKRESANGAELLFKLAGGAGVEGKVARIMGARREFVDQKAAIGIEKKFDGEESDDIKGSGDCGGQSGGFGKSLWRESCWNNREVENVIAVDVF